MPRIIIFAISLLFFSTFSFPSETKNVISQVPQVRHQDLNIDLSTQVSLTQEQDQSISLITQEIPVPLENPSPFLAVAIRIEGISEQATISYRASENTGWSEWIETIIDRDVAPSGSGVDSSLLILSKATKHIQFKVSKQSTNNYAEVNVNAFKISFISPGDTLPSQQDQYRPVPNLNRVSPESSKAKYPKPVVMTRTEWGCPDGQGNPRGTPGYTAVTHLIVHHTANANTATDWAAVVRSIWNFHIFTNGWSDIGYNYLIDPNGVVYEGRAGGDNVTGAHFSCQNSGTMGVALLGTFTSVKPTDAALASLKELLSWKADQREIDPLLASYHAGMQQSLLNISGHRDGNGLARSCTTTECPGEMFYPMLPGIRTEVSSVVNPVNDFSLTTTTPNQVVAKGSSISFPITSNILSGNSQAINLSVRNLPNGITAVFPSTSIQAGNSTQLSLTIPDTIASGIYAINVLANGSTKRSLDLMLTVTGKAESVSAASYTKAAPVAIESIVSAFGINLTTSTKAAETSPLPTTLADVSVKVKDSLNHELLAPLFYVSPTQINYLVPAGLSPGLATITILNKNEITGMGTITLARIAPGLFSANASGQGVAAAQLQRRSSNGTDSFESVAYFDDTQKLYFPRPLDLSNPKDEYFLLLYGTGIRLRDPAAAVTAQIGNTIVEVLYAGEQKEFFGLDQVNLHLTPNLIGQGQVELNLKIEGRSTNSVVITFK